MLHLSVILCRASPQLHPTPPLSIVNYPRQAYGKESVVFIDLKIKVSLFLWHVQLSKTDWQESNHYKMIQFITWACQKIT